MISLILPLILLISVTEDSAKTVLPPLDSVISQVSTKPEIEVTIKVVEIPLGTDSAIVDIMCDPNGMGVGGFELRISTISDLVSIVAVETGEMQVANHWSMFNAKETSPEKSWHIVSLARGMSDNDSLAVLLWPGAVSVARLIVRVGEPAGYWDTTHTIQFEWNRCSDNSFSDSTGTSLIVGHLADTVVQLIGGGGSYFENHLGPPRDCFARSPRPPADVIRFHNGGIIIRSDIEQATVQDTAEVDTIPPAGVDDPN